MSDLHRSKPPPTVNYRHTMPEIDRLMQVHKSCMVHGIGISKKAMDCTTYICTCANCVEEFFTGNSLPLAYCLQCPLKNIWLIFRIEYLMQKNSSVITGMAARGGGDIERDFLAQRRLHDYRGVYRYHLSNIGYTSTQVCTIS